MMQPSQVTKTSISEKRNSPREKFKVCKGQYFQVETDVTKVTWRVELSTSKKPIDFIKIDLLLGHQNLIFSGIPRYYVFSCGSRQNQKLKYLSKSSILRQVPVAQCQLICCVKSWNGVLGEYEFSTYVYYVQFSAFALLRFYLHRMRLSLLLFRHHV